MNNLIAKLKQFENSSVFDNYIKDNIFDPETEDFYNTSLDKDQVLINEIIHLIEKLVFSKEFFINTENIIKINEMGYPIEMVSEAEYFNECREETHRGTIKTNKCIILF